MSEAQLAAPAPPRAWPMYRAMVGVGLLCGLIIVSVFQATKPRIERNQAEALQRAIFQVLPAARSSATFRLVGETGFTPLEGEAAGQPVLYAGYGEGGELIGLAIEARGMGYADVIRILYGYSFEQDGIVGMRVLESKETPGLGDRIEKDPVFLENFRRLDVSLTADGSAIANPIVPVKNGTKQNPWEIDSITGATISSKAIARMLSASTAWWLPRIRQDLDAFRKPEAP